MTKAIAEQVSGEAERAFSALRRIIRAVDVQSKKLSRETGLSTPQLVVLKAINDLGEVTTRKLSAHVSLSQATVTSILDRLEARGYIERYRSQKDRRIVHSKLTAQGRKTIKTAPSLLQESFASEFAALPKTRKQEIITALEDIAQMMGAGEIDRAPDLMPASTLSV